MRGLRSFTIHCSFLLLFAADLSAREERKLEVEPAALELAVGEEAHLTARVVGADGVALEEDVFFFSRSRRSVTVDKDGKVKAVRPGEFTVVVRTARKDELERLTVEVPVVVPSPPLKEVRFVERAEAVYAGTTARFRAEVVDAAGLVRDDVKIELASTSAEVASVDPFGNVTGVRPGDFEIVARAAGFEIRGKARVVANPVGRLELSCASTHVRTGDVVRFEARTFDESGAPVSGVPVEFALFAEPDDDRGNAATGQVEPDGRFVAEKPGLYTIVATAGNASARTTIRADARNVEQKIVLVGRGTVHDVHTSDLWVWEGVDGRDYCVTGTWGANGDALFWDVTDPAAIERISKITVDARTVNDVKVSKDGKLCVISREGASNRRNGIVLIDVTDPREPEILSTFDDGLTGGVHNLYIYENHVFALSAGRRYDIINIDDVRAPRRVGTFELDTPGHAIHDVWVEDGIAYSSNWADGVQIVDVGNGVVGGTPANPVKIGSYAYPSGWNHAAFPKKDPETGQFLVIAGDEAFPYGLSVENKPTYPRGYFHFVDFTDMDNPREIARYEVPEAGSHNMWVEEDKLYAAYYNGGFRVVDISGEVMGDLYEQGREIGWFLPTDHEGKIPNASMVWGPQPYKGVVFFSDWNTGLWAVKLEAEVKE